LNEIHEINDRNHNLQRALALGNLEHSKIKIYFEDTISKKWLKPQFGALLTNQLF